MLYSLVKAIWHDSIRAIVISFIFRGEPFTIISLIYCILRIGISFFLLPLLFIILGFVFIFPGASFIGVIIALIFLYNYPALAIGLGIVISFIGISCKASKLHLGFSEVLCVTDLEQLAQCSLNADQLIYI